MEIDSKKQILIDAQNLSLNIKNKELLSNISLKISTGEIVTIIGPNGAGKTTLLRLLLGLITPNSGKIFKKHNLTIGYLPQKVNVDPILPLSVSRIMNLTGSYDDKDIIVINKITKAIKNTIIIISRNFGAIFILESSNIPRIKNSVENDMYSIIKIFFR